jgi:hypothetical protein
MTGTMKGKCNIIYFSIMAVTMQKKLILIIVCLIAENAIAQPYVDPLNIRYTSAFHNPNKNATPYSHLYIGSDIPIQLKNKSIIVFSPFYENWDIDSASNKIYLPQVSSIALAVTAIIPIDTNRWSLSITALPRFNSERLQLSNSFQMGGVLLFIYKKSETLKYKFGVYANSDFFGVFIMPLAGIDWRINSRNILFGVLPGRLTYEHKLNNNFYTGATFRAITNSYRLANGDYLRIDDNPLSIYLDWYATKHIVVTAEAGYGIMRKLRAGNGYNKNYITDFDWGDGMFIKLCASYRVRL